MNFFRTESFDVLKDWFDKTDKSKFINLYMAKSLTPSAPPIIVCAYGSNNKFEAIDVIKRWLFIYSQSLIQGTRVIGFSTDGDSRYLEAMRLCSGFFAKLPSLSLFRNNDPFAIKIPEYWSWFFMKQQQILLFMQDPTHILTKLRNRLLSSVANLTMGNYSIDSEDLIHLIVSKSKIEHNLIRSDVNPKDHQNFSSYLRISSELVLNLLNENDNPKGTYVYLTLLNLLISGFTNKSTTIEERLFPIWTVVFVCRLWFSWVQFLDINIIKKNYNSSQSKKNSNRDYLLQNQHIGASK